MCDLDMEKSEISRGRIHIYCGGGKGKTTAAVGLCVRAAGAGKRVLMMQMMKDCHSSERRVLESIPGITLMEAPDRVKFSFSMSDEEKQQERDRYAGELREVFDRARRDDVDVLVLDEVLYAIGAGLAEEALLIELLENRPGKLEVVLTGQNPGRAILEMADYVSEIRKVRHPYDQGLEAREGIEC